MKAGRNLRQWVARANTFANAWWQALPYLWSIAAHNLYMLLRKTASSISFQIDFFETTFVRQIVLDTIVLPGELSVQVLGKVALTAPPNMQNCF
jgi:hypothetical protein